MKNIVATVFGGKADPNNGAYDSKFIDDNVLGVALPYRFKGQRPKVKVTYGVNGNYVICDIVDVGPWNTNDPYWLSEQRPQAESGVDTRGRKTNKAGIDLTPAAAKAIGLPGKGVVDWEFVQEGVAPAPVPTPEVQKEPWWLRLLKWVFSKLWEKFFNKPKKQATPQPKAPEPKVEGRELPWVYEASKDIGVHETKGPRVTPEILASLDWADGAKDGHYIQGIDDDETPWCSSWLCGKFEAVGIKSPRSAWAQSWNNWGQKLAGPAVGCVVVFRWNATSGHVGLVVGKTSSGSLMVLGSNQADAVNVKAFDTSQVLGYRWPDGWKKPKTGFNTLPTTNQEQVLTTYKDTR